MLVHSLWLLSILSSAQAGVIRAAPACAMGTTPSGKSLVWDGRVNSSATAADFDGKTGPFDPDFVKGANVSFSQLVDFPGGDPALFDSGVKAKSVGVRITDQSIFDAGGNPQTAVRRTELIPRSDLVANNITTVGIKTLHFSLMPSVAHPLNLSHEYLMVFLERADFAGDIFMLKTGTLLGSNGSTKNDLVLFGNTQKGTPTLFTTPFDPADFNNFALRLDFTKNTLQVFYSKGNAPLAQVTDVLDNDLSGNGQYHFGLNKNPTNPGSDVLRSGFQESGINEEIVYGSIFIEDGPSSGVTTC